MTHVCIYFPNFGKNDQKLKILLYQVGNIGDLVVSTPVYRSLREKYSEAEITLLSSSGSKKFVGAEEIIKPLNLIDNIQTFIPAEFVSLKHYYSFYLTIRKAKYDLIVYLPSNLWKTFTIFPKDVLVREFTNEEELLF